MKVFRLYFVVLIVGIICGAYVAGRRVADAQCRANAVTDFITYQENIIKLQGDVNAEVFNRGVDDIRRVLHEKYTIAE